MKENTPNIPVNPFKVEYPTERCDLPSLGKCYSDNNPLSKGYVNLIYPDTEHEDILSTQSMIADGTVVDEFLKSIIADDIDYDTLIMGDKNAIMIAARIMLQGKIYIVDEVPCKSCGEKSTNVEFDLSKILDKEIDHNRLSSDNMYEYVFDNHPKKAKIKFSLPTVTMERVIKNKLKAIDNLNKKIGKNKAPDKEITVRMKAMINELSVVVDGQYVSTSKQSDINEFKILTLDAKGFRNFIKEFTPDVNRIVEHTCEHCDAVNEIALPMTTNFFWYNA